MLQVKNISKRYVTGELVQNALADVSLNLRDSEFVAVLGASGSGKTTLLNVIGGLDRYDEGDLIINGVSTKRYTDRDWDSYRNHTIGFVFQSYHLIPHQTVLSNVELALTIGGVSRAERKKRAMEALAKVGLKDQLHKKPNQLSGGQMQRVAIARALVNNPEILLADEPTGALDSETSIQIMDLLKEIASERLVVMVTHNPELADAYATRIVRLKDGKIVDDSNPFSVTTEWKEAVPKRNRTKMSRLTALSLSFDNLKTKKKRTLLTSFAGSIGIVGIALILSLSSGVNQYIDAMQRDTMTSYPVTISSSSYDLTSIMGGGMVIGPVEEETGDKTGIIADDSSLKISQQMKIENNLTSFKKYLDDESSEIRQYIGENGILYTYDISFDAWTRDREGNLISTDASVNANPSMNMGNPNASSSSGNFEALMKGTDAAVSLIVRDSYEVLAGEWADEFDEGVLFLDENNSIPIATLYQLGLVSKEEYQAVADQIKAGETPSEIRFEYAEVIGKTFYLVPVCDRYVEENGVFRYRSDEEVTELVENAIPFKLTGIVRAKKGAANATVSSAIGYTSLLTDYVISRSDQSAVVVAQEATPDVNVLNGFPFVSETDEERAEVAKAYIATLGVSDKAKLYAKLFKGSDLNSMSEIDRANALDTWANEGKDIPLLVTVYEQSVSSSSYDGNMKVFGKVSYDAPSSISIYTDSFEAKEEVAACIVAYNRTVEKEDQITYTDYVKLMTSSLTTIVNVISYVLIAFVAVSLVVSCIMIGIITHISVLERTKEIGVLRALGASKRNVSEVFNAETVIIGFCAGLLGVGITVLLNIPVNGILAMLFGKGTIDVSLPLFSAFVLVVVSTLITVIAGILPARGAAKKDPVIALRTE